MNRQTASRPCARTSTATRGAARCSPTASASRRASPAGCIAAAITAGLIFIDLRDRTGLVQLVFNPDAAGDGPRARPQAALRGRDQRRRRGRPARPRDGQPGAPDGRVRDPRGRGRAGRRRRDAAVRDRELLGRGRRGGAAALPLPRPAPRRRCASRSSCAPASPRRCASSSTPRASSRSRPRCCRARPRRARATSSSRPAASPGSFYALPQSPQLFKQLLMVAGLRALLPDRALLSRRGAARRPPARLHPARPRDVVRRGRGRARRQRAAARARLRAAAGTASSSCRCPRLPYDEAIARYGTDRPDTRFGLELVDAHRRAARDRVQGLPRRRSTTAAIVKGINAGARELPRSELDGLIGRAQELGAKGLVWAFREGDGWRSPVAKFLSDAELDELNDAPRGRGGRPAADRRRRAQGRQRRARPSCGSSSASASTSSTPSASELVWIVDWPMFEWDDEAGRWDPLHHPFTQPAGELDPDDARRRAGARLRRRLERPGARRGLDPHLRPRAPAARPRGDRHRARGGRASASASCSRRCATALRRTAGSPTGSTASSSACAARTRSAT